MQTQTESRAQLESLSNQKRELRLMTVQKTFDREELCDPTKLELLKIIVDRVRKLISRIEAVASPEKYMRIHVEPALGADMLREDSSLMEDLYKILPLTIATSFDPAASLINCQFDTATDLKTAEQILQLVLSDRPMPANN